MATRLFHTVIGVTLSLAGASCSAGDENVAQQAATDDSAAIDTAVAEVVDDSALADVSNEASSSAPDTRVAEAGDAIVPADVFTDAPTDADAETGWHPTK